MSLLMDALKKAEEEKKRAAKRLEQVESDARSVASENDAIVDGQQIEGTASSSKNFTETVQLSLEPLTEQADKTNEIPIASDSEESASGVNEKEVPTVDTTESSPEDLTLENTVVQEAFEKTQEAIDLSDTTIVEGLSTENVSAPFDDTFHGVLLEDEQEPDVYEETLPGVPADQLAKDLGGGEYQPTPVAAQTVFSAGKTNSRRSTLTWGIFVVLALLATGSFAVFYYFTITPVTRSLPSPEVARGIEFTPVPLPAVTAKAEPDVIAGTIISPQKEETELALVEEQTIEQQVVPDESISDLNENSLIGSVEPPNVKENTSIGNEFNKSVSIDEPENESSGIAPLLDVATTSDNVSFDDVDKTPLATISTDASLISISKSKAPKQVNIMVKQAFKAYEKGHYDVAKSIYQDVLKTEPDNRDARLGLAAIAINGKDREAAYFQYIHLLKLNPDDTLALNALIGLSTNSDPVKGESALKVLIQQEGDLPFLYFSLGNLYAKQRRWAEAQQAFFDAYRLDTTNPDYILNLAISLDHIGQYDTALDFYKTAINLSSNSYARFDFRTVNNRILALSKIIESKL